MKELLKHTMEAQEKKHEFVHMRASGLSYRAIAGKIGISKSTCCKWEHELEYAVTEFGPARSHQSKQTARALF